MASNKKPRRAYRPRDVAPVPLMFSATAAMATQLAVRTRQVVDALIGHGATAQHVAAVEVEMVCALHLVDAAAEHPGRHQVTAESVVEIANELLRISDSVRSIIGRQRETGRIGCTGPERQDLLALADLADQLREAFPRRMWHEAYRRGIERPVLSAVGVAA